MTPRIRQRLGLPYEDWPPHWQQLWDAAFDTGSGLFDQSGSGSHWAPDTRHQTRKGFSLFFGTLYRRGVLNPDLNPSAYLTEEHLRPYTDELAERVCSVTQASRLRDVLVGIRIMEPDADLTLIRAVVRRLQRRARPSRDKSRNLVQPKALFEAGIARMERVQTAAYAKADVKAVQYGDGLLMAIASCTLDRLKNLSSIRIGPNLKLANGRYVLRFEGDETKNHRPHRAELPVRLTQYIDTYIDVYRRQLLRNGDADVLFISCYRGPMARQTMYCRFVAATKQELGVRINPHRVRDMATTAIATDHPEQFAIAPQLLHHASLSTTQAHYNQATQLDASRRYNAALDELRSEALEALRAGHLFKET